MKAGVIITVIVLVLVIGGIIIFATSSSKTVGSAVSGQTVLENSDANSDTESNIEGQPSPTPEVKTFAITGRNYKFFIDGRENPDITVNEGDRVRIIFLNDEGFHDWRIDEFQAGTEKISQGQSSTTEFTAGRKGVFEYYCSVGQHRANGMKGKLIVQ